MQRMAETTGLAIRQEKHLGEALLGFEQANQYEVLGLDGGAIYQATEIGGSMLTRNFLHALRPWTIQIVDRWSGEQVLRVDRPFRFYFHQATVTSADGRPLGTIVRRWAWVRRCYDVFDANGDQAFELFGPLLHPWTFEIRREAEAIGAIRKRWSGLGKEWLTDADHFGIEWPDDLDYETKALLLGAVFLVDFVHFEDNDRN